MFSAPSQNSQDAKPCNETLLDMPQETVSVAGRADHEAKEEGDCKQTQQQNPVLYEELLYPIITQQEVTE